MDPATQTHPILSYVLSRIPTLSKPNKAPTSEFDIEQPPVHTPSPRTTPSSPSAGEFELVERMPGLRHPSVLRSMTCVVADVSAARGALQVRAPRPNHELVDSSRVIVAAAEACRAVVRLEETHDAYEALLHEAEVRLERVYRSAMEGTDLDDDEAAAESGKGEGPAAAEPKGGAGDAAVQEEVVGTRPGPGAPQHLWQSFPTAPMRAISRSTSGAQPPTATGPRTAHASAVADTHSSASSALAGSVTMRWIEHADVHHALPGDARPMLEQSVTSPKRAPFVSASPLNSSSPSEATDGNHAAAAAHLAVLKIAREPPRGHGTEAGGYGGGRPIPGEPARRTASARGRRWRRARWLSLMVQGQP